MKISPLQVNKNSQQQKQDALERLEKELNLNLTISKLLE